MQTKEAWQPRASRICAQVWAGQGQICAGHARTMDTRWHGACESPECPAPAAVAEGPSFVRDHILRGNSLCEGTRLCKTDVQRSWRTHAMNIYAHAKGFVHVDFVDIDATGNLRT